jgi:signal transduction histidine kinase
MERRGAASLRLRARRGGGPAEFLDPGKAIYLNPAGRRMLDISPAGGIEELPPRSQFYPQWALDIVEREAIPAATRNGSWVGETAVLSRDGREIPVSQVVIAHKSSEGDVEYVSTVVRDISQVKQLEQQLRRSQKMEAIGRLAGGVAHDFNNMLTVILGHTTILADARIDPDLQLSVAAIQQAAERAAALTNQLLAFSRKQILQPRNVSLNHIVAGMKDMLARVIEEHIDIRTVLAPDIGRVRADAAQIEQALMNVIVNSRDAMPKGGSIVIETSNADLDADSCKGRLSVPAGRYAVISVQDAGYGMDSQTLSHLFEPFFSTKPMGQASGLGLATAYGIVQQAGGYVTVYSEAGIGTTVRVYLPRIDGWNETNPAMYPVAGGIETILIVDDDEDVRRAARRSLEKCGYMVLDASSHSEALQISRTYTNTIHLLISDLVLSRGRGIELASTLLEARKVLKVLYVSGYTRQSAVDQGLLPANAAYVEKPFSLNVLSQKVRDILDEV